MRDLYLMSPPGPGWALRGRSNFRSQAAAAVNPATARAEWRRLAEAIMARGGELVVLPPDDRMTGLPYAAEAGHVVADADGGHTFLLPRMKSPHRQGERALWAAVAAALGFRLGGPERGVWEGQGDVAIFGAVALLFFGGRTDREGLDAASAAFSGETMEIEIREPAFHGNMALLPLAAADRMLVCTAVMTPESRARLEARFGAERLIDVTEEEIRSYATNGLPVGGALLAPSIVPARVQSLVRDLGIEVVSLPMGELCEKAGGASRCLVCHVPNVPDTVRVPDTYRYDPAAFEGRAP